MMKLMVVCLILVLGENLVSGAPFLPLPRSYQREKEDDQESIL
jgi:hypothetical protein